MSALTSADATAIFHASPDRYIDVGEGEVAYRRVGHGPDVLFVHGWPVSGATFRKLLPALAEHVTCHVVDLLSAGASRVHPGGVLSIGQHIHSVRRVADEIGLERFAAVGHDSGGLIARHAFAGDPRLTGLGLIDTEQPRGLNWRFRMFVANRRVPGFGAILGWLASQPRLRRNGFVLGDAFVDRSLLDGDFDAFFLQPLVHDRQRQAQAVQVLRSFSFDYVRALGDVHRRIEVPVRLVWGEHDRFFPVAWAQEMVATFPNASLTVVPDAGLFSHEERPEAVAAALLPVLIGG